MRIGVVTSFSILVLSALVTGWSELYLPARESLNTDVLKLAGEMVTLRREIRQGREELPRLEQGLAGLQAAVAGQAAVFPSPWTNDLFIVVNTSANRLYLRRGEAVLLEAKVSTGSGDTLQSGARRWVFETPRGVRTIIRKKDKPVWYKPDWAFLEAGEPVPPADSPLRRQPGVLGDYLLDLGGGVMIHGTQQTHLLGRSVTHGCVRVGRDDLKVLYDSVPLRTKVYIH